MQIGIIALCLMIRPFGADDLEDAAAGAGIDAVRSLKKSAEDIHSEALTSTEAPKRDEAEEGYALVEEQLGGRAGIEKYGAKSKQLSNEVKRRLGNREAWRQDVIFHHEGLQALIDHGRENVKPKFDCLVKKVAEKFQAKAIIPGFPELV